MEKSNLNCFNHRKFLWTCGILCISWPTLDIYDWQCSFSAVPQIVCIISAEFLGDIFLAWNNDPFHKLLALKKVKKRAQKLWDGWQNQLLLCQDPPRYGPGRVLKEQPTPQLPTHEHVYLSFFSPPALTFPGKSSTRPALVRNPHLEILPILYLQTLEKYPADKH